MSDLPRLLLCSFDVIPGPSGSSRRLTEYLKALPDRFHVVVLSAKTPDHSHIEKYQGARLLRVPVGGGDLASRIQAFERAVRRQLESEEYSLVHFTDPFGGYALCELKADYGYRLIYEAHTFPSMELRYTHPHTEGDRRFLAKIRRQELFCLMSSDRVVTGSQATRSYIQSLGVSDELVQVVRAPVDLSLYAPESLGAPDGTPLRLMYLGSQVGWQGVSTLLRAVALAAQHEDVRLTLVGPRHPDWQPHLDALVTELGLQQRVEFQSPVAHDDVAKVLALADVGVLPLDDVERNQQQGGPLAKVSEYFAAARPVIAADLPVTRELVPASTALFFPPGDAAALSERILELARDIPRRTAMGREARAFAEKALDAGLIRGQLLDIYDMLLEQGAPVAVTAPLQTITTTVTGTPTNRILQMTPPGDDREEARPAEAEPPPAEPVAAPPPAPPDELPLLLGRVLDEGLDTRLIVTEPDARPNEPPVVMGLPLRDTEAPPPASTRAENILNDVQGGARPAEPPAVLASMKPSREEPAPRASVASALDDLLAIPAPAPRLELPSAVDDLLAIPEPAPRVEAPAARPAPPAPAPREPAPTAPPVLRSSSIAVRELTPARPLTAPPRLEPSRPPSRPATPTVSSRASVEMEPLDMPKAPAPPPLPPIAQRVPSSPSFRIPQPTEPPRLTPVEPPGRMPGGAPPVLTSRPLPAAEDDLPLADAEELSDAEDLPEADAEEVLEAEALPHAASEEPEELSNEELQEASEEAVEEVDESTGPEIPGAQVDPWFAQLAHGYCPPEGARFVRHTPPTNFPGRDEDTDPSRLPPEPRPNGSSRGRAP
ncbi:glycosyltransferase [Myxococcaceae bacterium GXIMD 01537]